MPDIFSDMTSVIDGFADDAQVFDPYFYFEPFDCEYPSAETIAKAEEDQVDLFNDDVAKLCGPYPRPFQSGVLMSKKRMCCQLAASRSGKSVTSQVIVGAAISRQPPYSLRYEKGVETNIKRAITPVNIRRFGRMDARTGTIIDSNIHARIDPTEWNCGNIVGAGIFPEELYAPDGDQIWIGTVAPSIKTLWWPVLAGTNKQRFLPMEFLDTTKGNNGSNHTELTIHCQRDVTIFIKSYDAPRITFESEDAHLIIWDEEPTRTDTFISGDGHSKYQRFSFTALNGLSFTNSLFFGHCNEAAAARAKQHGVGVLPRDDFDFFQASKYDSPYIEASQREANRRAQPLHSRKQIVWGRYAEHSGEPFFDRSKLEHWRNQYCHPHRKVRLSADSAYEGIGGNREKSLPGLLDIKVVATKAMEDDLRTVFRIYENPIPGVGYLWLTDAAEGATDPSQSQDFNFGIMMRKPRTEDRFENIAHYDHPVIVATIRSTLQTQAYANLTSLALRWYNNAVLAPERGHGKDNEAYGLTLDDWPYWYFRNATNDATQKSRPKKGFDTNAGTRDSMLLKVRTWLDEFEKTEDPLIKDSWLYDELAGAITKVNKATKKKRCDHPRNGYLDGVICLAIGTFIFDETPDVIECNYTEPEKKHGPSFLEMIQKKSHQQNTPPSHMGAGVGKISGR